MEGKEQRFGIVGSTLFADAHARSPRPAPSTRCTTSYTALGGMHADDQHDARRGRPRRRRSRASTACSCSPSSRCSSRGLSSAAPPSTSARRSGRARSSSRASTSSTTPTLVLARHRAELRDPGGPRGRRVTSRSGTPGVHGFSEVLYAFTSAANNNGSAFAGLTANTPVAQHRARRRDAARPVPPDRVRARPRRLARGAGQGARSTAGTLPTHRPQFVGLLVGVAVIVTALTYFPVLALGPLAEGLV